MAVRCRGIGRDPGAPHRRRRFARGTPASQASGGAMGAMVASIVMAFLTVAVGLATVVLGGYAVPRLVGDRPLPDSNPATSQK
jgi:hypothetical protein